MGINIVRFDERGTIKWGVLDDEKVYEVKGDYPTLAVFLEKGADVARKIVAGDKQHGGLDLDSLHLLSPVTSPAQIVCQGANYSAHREEAGLESERPPFNLIFTKANSSLTGPNDDILCPSHVRLLDYEIEVGLIVRKEITEPIHVTLNNIAEYVAGFVITNDVSARDTQLSEGQWFKGKSYRSFCPAGPILYLIEDHEASYIHNLELKLTVNGEVRQSAHTEQLLYKPEETITELSETMSFYPGDLLMTGTPGGVALKLTSEEFNLLSNPFTKYEDKMKILIDSQKGNRHYLKDGDVVTSEVQSSDGKIHLGKQTNRVVFN
ncbi:fumarylacetoacetate hydrolase family protein [Evansella halocellulosilytica]|uniref:fumarylacetoacetate hydrolase family protein n=1 Tax=Evansella halocellulosilytica TaxID=2011013 RepID=UPI000BB995F7|nr:fumarylacetoacetate hydrolase family protein [Evansella halocellulosilytica]